MNLLWATFVRLRFTRWPGLLSTVVVCAQASPISSIRAQLNRPQSDVAQARLYLALGEAYLQTKLDSARYCFQRSIDLAEKQTDKRLLAKGYLKLGYTYFQQRQFNEAIHYHQQAVKQQPLGEVRDLIGLGYFSLAKDYQALHQYQPALGAIDKSTTLFSDTKSIHYFQQALVVKSELLQAVAQTQIAALRKNLTIQKQAQQAVQLQLTVAKQQRLLYLIGVLMLLKVVAAIGYFSIRRQRAAQRLLLAQKEEIQQQASQLTELTTSKDKLFSLVSHDLRSPMAHLKQNFYQLRDAKQVPASLRKPIYQLENQVDGILNMLTNLLDWSHSQLTGFQSRPQRIDLTQAITDVVSQLSDQLNYKDIGVVNQLIEPVFVEADRHQLHSILRNLLSNAVKFTPTGGYIRLQAGLQGDKVELTIQDTGIGIPADELANLLNNPTVRTGTQGEPSTGLGLRLSQNLLARQGGSITISSQPGKGTTVRIRLPQSYTNRFPERAN